VARVSSQDQRRQVTCSLVRARLFTHAVTAPGGVDTPALYLCYFLQSFVNPDRNLAEVNSAQRCV